MPNEESLYPKDWFKIGEKDLKRAEKEFGFKAKTPFEEGLKKTIQWYKREKSA